MNIQKDPQLQKHHQIQQHLPTVTTLTELLKRQQQVDMMDALNKIIHTAIVKVSDILVKFSHNFDELN